MQSTSEARRELSPAEIYHDAQRAAAKKVAVRLREHRAEVTTGTAWVRVRADGSPFLDWCMATGVARLDQRGNYIFDRPGTEDYDGNDIEVLEAGAHIFACELQAEGFEAFWETRDD